MNVDGLLAGLLGVFPVFLNNLEGGCQFPVTPLRDFDPFLSTVPSSSAELRHECLRPSPASRGSSRPPPNWHSSDLSLELPEARLPAGSVHLSLPHFASFWNNRPGSLRACTTRDSIARPGRESSLLRFLLNSHRHALSRSDPPPPFPALLISFRLPLVRTHLTFTNCLDRLLHVGYDQVINAGSLGQGVSEFNQGREESGESGRLDEPTRMRGGRWVDQRQRADAGSKAQGELVWCQSETREMTYVGLLRVRLGRLVGGGTTTAGGVTDDGDCRA